MSNQVFKNSEERYFSAKTNVYELLNDQLITRDVIETVKYPAPVINKIGQLSYEPTTGVYTVKAGGAGLYLLSADYAVSADAVGTVAVWFEKGGSAVTLSFANTNKVTGGLGTNVNNSISLELQDADTFQIKVEYSGGAATLVLIGKTPSPIQFTQARISYLF